MAKNNEYQCQYGLCGECIVYLCNSGITFLSDKEIHEVLLKRGLDEVDSTGPCIQH